jgi:hypothetical protein
MRFSITEKMNCSERNAPQCAIRRFAPEDLKYWREPERPVEITG